MALWTAAVVGGLVSGLSQAAGYTVEKGADGGAVAAPSFMHEDSDLPADPAVTYGTLPNGLRYAIMPNTAPAGILSLRLGVDVGSLDERDGEEGLAHFIEHLAFNGTARFAEGEMVQALERVGLRLGADTNAVTGTDLTTYRLDLPNTKEETVHTALTVLREIAGEVRFTAEAVDKERKVVAAERRVRDTLSARRARDWKRFMLAGTLIPDRSPIGDAEVTDRVGPAALRAFYRRHYRPDRAILVAVGDIAPADLERRIEAQFGSWAAATTTPAERQWRGELHEAVAPVAGLFVDPGQSTVISLGWPRPARPRDDSAAARRRTLLETTANVLFTQRLRAITEPGDAPFLTGTLDAARHNGLAEGVYLTLTADKGQWEGALAKGVEELNRALKYGFTDAEIARHVTALDAAYERAVTEAGNRRSPTLAAALLGSIRYGAVFTSPADNAARLDAFRDQITAGTVSEAFRAQFTPSVRFHLSTNDIVPGGTDALLNAYARADAKKVAPPRDKAERAFAYTDFGRKGTISEEREGPLGERQLRFANNVRLNIKKTDYEEGRVWVRVTVAGGLLSFADSPDGAAYFARAAFPSGGLGQHSVGELERLLSGRKVGFGLAVKSNTLAATNVTTNDDLLLQLQLHAALLTDPGYRKEGERRFGRLVERAAGQFDKDPGAVASTALTRWLRGGDVRFGTGPAEVLMEQRYKDISPLLADQLQNGYIEIGITGDVDEAAAIDAVARTFGALPERRAAPLPYKEARKISFPKARHRLFHHRGERDKARLYLYWPTGDSTDGAEQRRLTVLRSIVDLKMTTRLREELGATYSPSVSSVASDIYDGYGYFRVMVDTAPARTEEVLRVMEDVIVEVREGGITEDELVRARTPLLERLDEADRSNRSLVSLLSYAQRQPGWVEDWQNRRAYYEAVTVETLTAAARRHLAAARTRRVLILPEPLSPRPIATADAGKGADDNASLR